MQFKDMFQISITRSVGCNLIIAKEKLFCQYILTFPSWLISKSGFPMSMNALNLTFFISSSDFELLYVILVVLLYTALG